MVEEKKVVSAIQNLKEDWKDRFGTKNRVANQCINDLEDLLYYISIGKYDKW